MLKATASLAGLMLGMRLAGARADGIAPPDFPVGDATLTFNGSAHGAALSTRQPGPSAGSTGAAKLSPSLTRDYDSGLSLSLNGTFAAEDPLSRGRYDGDAVEKAYAEAKTGLGRIRVGLADGAAYDLAVTGPKTDPAIAIDDAQTTFFRDPATGRALTDIFALRTEVGASSNYAKFVYESPSLFGATLGLSFTPTEGKAVIPFLREGPQVPGRQIDIWEGALRYSDDFGPLTVSASGAASFGRAEHKLGDQEGVSDLGAGLRGDYTVDDELSLSLGGSWRQSNAYAFHINNSYQSGTTRAFDASAGASWRAWSLALEYGNGIADAVGGASRLALNGSEASVGFTLAPGILFAGGWQHLTYGRGSGAFYNGATQLGLDAAFIHVNLNTVP